MLKASLCLVALLLSASIAPSFAHADTSAPTLKHAGRGLLQLDSDVVEDSLDNLQLPDEEALSPETETTADSEPPVAEAETPVEAEDADGPEASASSSTSVGSGADGPSDDEVETEGPTASVAESEAEGPAAEGPGAEDLEEDLFIEEDLATSPKPEPEFEITESSGSSMATVGVFGLGLISSAMLGLLL